MQLYAGIDLHSNNSLIVIVDTEGNQVYQKRLDNELNVILKVLETYKSQLTAIAIESTFNWYWLVDGLVNEGYKVHLTNTAAIQHYSGLKYTDDKTDARWLAELLRLNLLPKGYIYPKEERGLRDLLRKRGRLVQQRTQNILSLQNIVLRETSQRVSGSKLKTMPCDELKCLLKDNNVLVAAESNLQIIKTLDVEIKKIEKLALKQSRIKPEFLRLKTVPGIGDILGLVIMLETGSVDRFNSVGNYSSYCRCVDSKRISNGKKKGVNNKKNGNKFLAWAFIEAAIFAIRFDSTIKKYYQRKMSKTKQVIAIKTVAHKLARACFYIMRDGCEFDVNKAFT